MTSHNNLTIIGTSHIASHSVREIEQAFRESNPDVVAVELDHSRLQALLSEKKPDYSPWIIREIGLKGYLFAVIGGLVQQKLGDIVGVKPGSDMLKAITLARDNGRKIALIDRDIRVTLSRLSKKITWKERFNFLIDIFRAPFSKRMHLDLSKVPEKKMIFELMKLLKTRYPGLYQVLVEERNHIMALKLHGLMENYPDKHILAVVGAGHEEALLSMIKNMCAG
ncbi:MAG: TraB/GumN family protein [archaeon]